MAQLSEVDFQRLQETLLELKTRNYTVEDQSRKQRHQLGDVTARLKVIEQELEKKNRTIEKSKKITEVQKILNENENLQRKLISQEEDFRLQNQTLLQELQLVVKTNEKLEKETKDNKENRDNEKDSLDKENLQKEISNLYEKINFIETVNADYEQKVTSLENELSNAKQKEIEQLTDEFNLSDTEDIAMIKDSKLVSSEAQDLRMKLDYEIKEGKLARQHNEDLKAQIISITTVNQSQVEQILGFEGELEKKQTELKIIQDDKKVLMENQKLSIEKNEQFLGSIKEENRILQKELQLTKQTLQESNEKANSKVILLNETIQSLEVKISEYPEDFVKELEADNICLRNQIEKIKIDSEKEYLNLEKIQIDFDKLSMEYSIMKTDRDENVNVRENLTLQLESLTKVSENRKSMLDEKVVELQQVVETSRQQDLQLKENMKLQEEEHRNAINKMSETSSRVNQELELKVAGLEEQVADLEVWPEKQAETQAKYEEEETARNKAEEDLQNQEVVWREEENKLTRIHQEHVEMESIKWKEKLSDLETQLELVSVQKCEFEEKVAKLHQELHDGVEERKISEKKGQALLKDLKRQLQSEKRKNDKLQEKMKECFETTSNISNGDGELLDPDRTSISSWSLMSGERGGDRISSSTPKSSSSPIPLQDQEEVSSMKALQRENEDLCGRLASLQESKWQLEERLNMLEQSGASMAEDLVNKSKLISNYCMEDKQKMSPVNNKTGTGEKMKIFVDKLDKFVHQPGALSKEVINMQKMLEETLTKNINLQRDLENMSQEIVRLSNRSSTN